MSNNIIKAIDNATSSNKPIIITDLYGKIVYANSKWCNQCKYTLTDIKGKTNKFLQGSLTSKDDINIINYNVRKGKGIIQEIINFKGDNMPFRNLLEIECLDDGYKAIVTDLGDIEYTKQYNNMQRRLTY